MQHSVPLPRPAMASASTPHVAGAPPMSSAAASRARMEREWQRYAAKNPCVLDQASGVLKRKPYLIPAGVILAISSLTIVGSMMLWQINTSWWIVRGIQAYTLFVLAIYVSLLTHPPTKPVAAQPPTVTVFGAPSPVSFCSHCNVWRVRQARAHHCRECNTCITNRDHHCPWINGCVGLHNQRNFLLFVGYTAVLCLIGVWAFLKYYSTSVLTYGTSEDSFSIIWLLQALPILGGGLYLTGYLFIRHLYLVLLDLTGRELKDQLAAAAAFRRLSKAQSAVPLANIAVQSFADPTPDRCCSNAGHPAVTAHMLPSGIGAGVSADTMPIVQTIRVPGSSQVLIDVAPAPVASTEALNAAPTLDKASVPVVKRYSHAALPAGLRAGGSAISGSSVHPDDTAGSEGVHLAPSGHLNGVEAPVVDSSSPAAAAGAVDPSESLRLTWARWPLHLRNLRHFFELDGLPWFLFFVPVLLPA